MLVPELLEMAIADAQAERSGAQAADLGKFLEKRDKDALETARKAGADDNVLRTLRQFLAEDRARQKRAAKGERYLELSTEAYTALLAVTPLLVLILWIGVWPASLMDRTMTESARVAAPTAIAAAPAEVRP